MDEEANKAWLFAGERGTGVDSGEMGMWGMGEGEGEGGRGWRRGGGGGVWTTGGGGGGGVERTWLRALKSSWVWLIDARTTSVAWSKSLAWPRSEASSTSLSEDLLRTEMAWRTSSLCCECAMDFAASDADATVDITRLSSRVTSRRTTPLASSRLAWTSRDRSTEAGMEGVERGGGYIPEKVNAEDADVPVDSSDTDWVSDSESGTRSGVSGSSASGSKGLTIGIGVLSAGLVEFSASADKFSVLSGASVSSDPDESSTI